MPEELIELLGGNDRFVEKLNVLFNTSEKVQGEHASSDISGLIGQYAHGNEPSHHTAYLFNVAGQPWRTQELVHQIRTELYSDQPDGLCGNEDCGQMSAWYVLNAIGFYPLNPADGIYHIGTPAFDELTLKLSDTVRFTITAENLSADNYYVQELELNGEIIDRNWITHEEIMSGGKLHFTMGPEPRK